MKNVTVFDLVEAFKTVLERKQDEKPELFKNIDPQDVKIDDRIEYILTCIEDNNEVLFDDLFKDDNRKIVLIVTFMAILELTKMKKISFRQETQFGSLFLKKHSYLR